MNYEIVWNYIKQEKRGGGEEIVLCINWLIVIRFNCEVPYKCYFILVSAWY